MLQRPDPAVGFPVWWCLSCTTELALHRLMAEMIQERIAQQAALLAAKRKTQRRTVDLRDTLIAGIALANEAQVATRKVLHFSDTISLINPFQ